MDNPGYMLIKVLLNKNELKNDERSLKNLREKLQNSHLHRAIAVLDRAVQKQVGISYYALKMLKVTKYSNNIKKNMY